MLCMPAVNRLAGGGVGMEIGAADWLCNSGSTAELPQTGSVAKLWSSPSSNEAVIAA